MPGTWYPNLTFDLCQVSEGSWEKTQQSPGDLYPECRFRKWYICPGGAQTQRCRGPEYYYCKQWGCEAYNNAAYWTGAWGGPLSFYTTTLGESNISTAFTSEGKVVPATDCIKGKSWGLRLYKHGGHYEGLIFRVRLLIETLVYSIGPNSVLGEQGPPKAPRPQVPLVLPTSPTTVS